MTKVLLWFCLVAVSAALLWLFKTAGIPAALLLGPLLAGMAFGLLGADLRPAPGVRLASQTVVGCVIAVVLGESVDAAILRQIGPAAALSASTLILALGLGWALTRLRWFEGPTAIWGLAPGGSAAMVTLAEENGGDARIVAMMQYFRIFLVACSAIVIAHLIGSPVLHTSAATVWFSPLNPLALVSTVLFAIVVALAGQASKIPAGALLLAALGGGALIATHLITLQVPPLAAAAAYAVVGWNIGLGFSPAHLLHVAHALPRMIVAVLGLILACAGAGMLAARVFGLDPLTAYLASSPGGVDTMLIISTSTPVDLPFVLACQVTRFVFVVAAAPWLITLMARRTISKR